MVATTEAQLRQLRKGNLFKYHGVQWQVKGYSTYTDSDGYETEEWLLTSQTGKQYYLMREIDSDDGNTKTSWFLAEELQHPTIYQPGDPKDVLLTLPEAMRSHKTPYPELQVFNRVYQFESQTEGEYKADGEVSYRITWDYWDKTHLWNLALEAWKDGTFAVYSTREVQPSDFTDFKQGYDFSVTENSFRHSFRANSISPRTIKILAAWLMMLIGFVLMISGI
jgi:hypothetical protein